MDKWLREFREFALRGSVVDLAVGFIVGAAFSAIVKSLVDDILMPPLGLLFGHADFTNFFITLSGGHYETLSAARAAHAVTLNYGAFINVVINFLIIALAMFVVVRQINRLQRRQEQAAEAPPPATRSCPYCITPISIDASRCPNCTSDLTAPPVRPASGDMTRT